MFRDFLAFQYCARLVGSEMCIRDRLIAIGYVCGIVSKICSAAEKGAGYWKPLTILAFVFYFINLVMVSAGILIYFRNKRLDAKRAAEGSEEVQA